MNAIVKTLIVIAIIISFGTLMGTLVPVAMSANINNAIIYALKALSVLGFLFHVDTLYNCIGIIVNFFIGICIFIVAKWILHLFTK